MPDLADGESTEMKGSGAKPYVLKNSGGVYSCTCPAWRNQSTAIERRTCKHLRKLRGDAAEEARLGGALPQKPVRKAASSAADDGEAGAGDAGPPLLLAETWDNAADLSGWWMSEKLDGVRAYWDGKQFLSRLGNLFHAPDWFVDKFPACPLDGELWIDRKKFQRTVSIVRRQDKTDLWKEVRFLVFDAPAEKGGFEDRVDFVKVTLAKSKPTYARPLDHEVCKDLDCLRAELARVEALGGEGLMLRQPGSKYEAGRSSTLVKVKSFRDAEALVVSHVPGAGKHKGRLGALAVRLADGTEFSVGTGFSDRERGAPPPVGTTITFRYQELSEGGVPRFPSYVGVRIDVPPVKADKPKVVSFQEPQRPKCAAKSTAAAGTAAAATVDERYFEFTDNTSNKFWAVACDGCDMTTRWGRIGAAGQTTRKTFANPDAARAAAGKLVDDKTGEGYVETPRP